MTSSLEATGRPVIPIEYNPRHVLLEAARPGPLDWARRRRAEKEARRLVAVGQRAATRLDPWPDWHVVELPRTTDGAGQNGQPSDPPRFLAIGPGGVFAVCVLDHGRSRVLLAGDVVQISGRRPPYVAQARREAKRASAALSRAVGTKVPVVPVLALVGTGPVSYYGLPKNCLVTTYRELDRVLASRGERIAPTTAVKLSAVARHPGTWGEADQYRWYRSGAAAADKKPSRR
jgi:hypothetical protein